MKEKDLRRLFVWFCIVLLVAVSINSEGYTAAASILAKTHRDEYMLAVHNEFPQYHWDTNKGYPTRDHKDAINEHGICRLHRKSFNMNEQLRLGF